MVYSPTVERGLAVLGYPSVLHGVINRYVTDLDLDVAPNARIASGCLLRGDVELAPRSRLSRGCVLNGEVTVGRGSNLEPNCELVGEITIGNYCAIARRTTFQQTNHETGKPALQIRLYDTVLDSELEPATKGPIEIGSDVWSGAGATILSDVTVGHGAVIGAGAVVTRDVEPYAIVAGIPAERIGWRFPRRVRESLLELAWWEWDEATIRDRVDFFERTLDDFDDVPDEELNELADVDMLERAVSIEVSDD